MSTVQASAPIDSSLPTAATLAAQAPQGSQPPSTSPKTGTKRKGRASVSGSAVQAGNYARVTRRSGGAGGAADGDAEPARGEEENLIGHPSGGSASQTKRRRQSSSRYAAGQAAQSKSNNSNIDPVLQDAGSSTSDAKPAGASASTSQPRQPRFPYPYGLTPFRYPCLTPHLPNPPPGDPLNPSLKLFDPTAPLSSQPDAPPPQHQSASMYLPAPGAAGAMPELSGETETSYTFGPEATADAYESLTALLDASGPHGANPSSPGERSDGKGGPLTPQMQGRYHMASKEGCDDCREGKGGHWGHWVKSSAEFTGEV